MKRDPYLLRDVLVGVAIFVAVVAVMLFSVGGSARFIYQAF